MDQRIEADLRILGDRLEHLKTLLQWQQLADDEYRRNHGHLLRPPSIEQQQDIAVAHGAFISLAVDLQASLDRASDVEPSERVRGNQRLRELVDECQALRVPHRFIYR